MIFEIFFVLGRLYFFVSLSLVILAAASLGFHQSPHLRIGKAICAWALLAVSLPILGAYITEAVSALRSNNVYEAAAFRFRITGPYAYAYWFSLAQYLAPQCFWFRRLRQNSVITLGVGVIALEQWFFDFIQALAAAIIAA